MVAKIVFELNHEGLELLPENIFFRMKKFCIVLSFLAVVSCNSTTDNAAEPVAVSAVQKQNPAFSFDKNFSAGKISEVKCYADTSVSYSIFLPSDYDTTKNFPIILFFDAHARGSLPLKKYLEIGEKYHFIFAGSNNSKNGMDLPSTNSIAQKMWTDILHRFSIDQKIVYACGFSGGAKVAAGFAFSRTDFAGVIANSSPFDEQLLSSGKNISVFLLAGNLDFNFTGAVAFDKKLSSTGVKHQLVVFDGKHDWADKNSFEEAMQWMLMRAADDGKIQRDKISFSAPDFNSWKKENYDDEKILQQENETEDAMGQNFAHFSFDYWKQKISLLNKAMNAATAKNIRCSYSRELNYMSMLGFVFTDGAVQRGEYDLAKEFLAIYQLADPQNSDVWYFKAVLSAQSGGADVYSSLEKSVQLGFYDSEKLMNEPAFSQIKNSSVFQSIVAKAEANKNKM